MEAVLYSWLGAAALAPFIAILSAWTLVVFRNYRKQWRLVDLFLFALTSHEVIASLFAFGFAVLSIIRPLLGTPCGFIIWGLTATRTFHLSAVTSLLLDRALSARWPYTYRSSVRRSQVRYHIVVLAIIAVFVGVTAVFARVPTPNHGICSIHPLAWDIKFSVFLASVYGMLLLTGFSCCLVVQAGRIRAHGSHRTVPEVPGWESGQSTSSSSSSKQLKKEWCEHKDVEWKTIACVGWLSYIVNHGPFLVMTIMGIAVPTFWSPWLDNTTIWLSLSQGTLVPLMLLLADLPHRSALRNMLRQPGRIYRHLSDHGGFRLQVGEMSGAKKGMLPPFTMFPSSGGLPVNIPFHIPHRLRWTPNTLPSLQSLHPDRRRSMSPLSTSSEAESVAKCPKRCTSPLPPHSRGTCTSIDSSCYSLLSLRSSSSKLFSSPSSTVVSSRGQSEDALSITTDAIDDFEFHGANPNRNIHPHLRTIFQISNYGIDRHCGVKERNTNPIHSTVVQQLSLNGANVLSESSKIPQNENSSVRMVSESNMPNRNSLNVVNDYHTESECTCDCPILSDSVQDTFPVIAKGNGMASFLHDSPDYVNSVEIENAINGSTAEVFEDSLETGLEVLRKDITTSFSNSAIPLNNDHSISRQHDEDQNNFLPDSGSQHQKESSPNQIIIYSEYL